MPVNLINAKTTVVVGYSTPQAQHKVRFYIDEQLSGADAPDFVVPSNIGTPAAVQTMAQVVEQIRTRVASLTNWRSIDFIEVVNTTPVDNEFLGYVQPITFTAGDGVSAVASSHRIYVFGSAVKQQYRFSLFDSRDASPQRFPAPAVPTVDNGTIEWLLLRSGIPFCTQDGHRLQRLVSINTGYNKGLARRYGRILAP